MNDAMHATSASAAAPRLPHRKHAPDHAPTVVHLFGGAVRARSAWRKQTWHMPARYARLWWDRPSPTIRTGVAPSQGRFVHPTADRGITPREAARLQSFPDAFGFCGTRTRVQRQIGNAVRPVLAHCIAEAVHRVLRKSSPGA